MQSKKPFIDLPRTIERPANKGTGEQLSLVYLLAPLGEEPVTPNKGWGKGWAFCFLQLKSILKKAR